MSDLKLVRDDVESLGRWLVDASSWLLLATAFIPVSFGALHSRRDLRRDLLRTPEEEGEALLQDYDPKQMEFLFKFQEESSAHTDEKVKHLLALSSGLSGLAFAVSGLTIANQQLVWVALPLAFCAYLCIAFFGVRAYYLPSLPNPKDDPKGRAWADNLHSAYLSNESFRELRVEIYRGARRWFMVALIAFAGLVIATVRSPAQGPTPAERLLERLDRGVPVTTSQAALDSLVVEIKALRHVLESHPARALRGGGSVPVPHPPEPMTRTDSTALSAPP